MSGSAAVLLAVAVVTGVAVAARRMLVMVRVIGDSMEPTLYDGDRILVRRRKPADLRYGDIAVLKPPAMPSAGYPRSEWHIKRVAALPGQRAPRIPRLDSHHRVPVGTVVVLGDNPRGRDSRDWGPYPAAGLVGTYLCRMSASMPS